ncbi:hypothetical protein HZQ67_13835 [Elizabethkingia anophelis]|nr:hypothetical protein [Elizabethkingia anophelis]MCT3788451.1 hypothetical protein [Elizabethkingia anophelis]MCT3824958.1 hypothetical protein [Elizabethkingia anophelis]
MYIEYKSENRDDWNYFGSKINPGRNYFMFGLLSKGVRSQNEKGIEPKGLPDNMSYKSSNNAYIYINDDYDENDDEYCSIEIAKRWAEYGCKIIFRDEKPFKVEHPDWHSHSWLTTQEFEKQLEIYNSEPGYYPEPEYMAVLASMKELEKYDNECRIVFWFDN